MMHRNNHKKGISTMIGAIFMVAIIAVGITVLSWGVNQQNKFDPIFTEKNVREVEKVKEKIETQEVKINNNKFNMTVVNTGTVPVKLIRMWVTNTTDTNGWHKNYTLNNKLINPGDTLVNLGQDLSLVAKNSSSYKINLATERGSSDNFNILSPKDKAIKMSLFATPRSIPTGQNVTIMYGVTNNLTSADMVQSIKPKLPLSWTATEAPSGSTTATATLMEGPTPTAEDSLSLGETVFFKWVYKITGDAGDKIKFNATIVNAKQGNYITETVEVAVDSFAEQSNTSALSLSISSTNGLVKKGSFAKCTTTPTCSQTNSTVGFKPKALILWTERDTIQGFADIYDFAIGFSDGTNSRSIGVMSHDNVDTHKSGRAFGAKILQILSSGNPQTITAEADLTSFNSDGFTLNWTTNDATASIIHYIAIGSGVISNAKVGIFTANTATGNQAVTGVGFQPDFVMFMQPRSTSDPGTANHINMGLGFAKSSAERGALEIFSRDNRDDDKKRFEKTDRCILQLAEPTPTIDAEADFYSMDSNGFTINWIDPPGSADKIYYLALKGGQFKVGNFNQKTSTGTQSQTGVGFQPVGLLFSSVNNVASTVVNTNNRLSVGGAHGTGDGNEGSVLVGDQDNVAFSVKARSTITTKVIRLATEAATGSSSTINAEADLQSFDLDGFTLNWTTADATAREILYVAIGKTMSVYSGGDVEVTIQNTGTDTIWVDENSRITFNNTATGAVYAGLVKSWKNETSLITGNINSTSNSDGLEPGKSLKFYFSEPMTIPGKPGSGTSVITNLGSYNVDVRLTGYDAKGGFVLRIVQVGVVQVA